jgi:hypothetical protein
MGRVSMAEHFLNIQSYSAGRRGRPAGDSNERPFEIGASYLKLPTETVGSALAISVQTSCGVAGGLFDIRFGEQHLVDIIRNFLDSEHAVFLVAF